MRLEASDISDLKPVIREVVHVIWEKLQSREASIGDRLAYTESEAAEALNVKRHVLRDARLRGEITASKIGKRIVYEKSELIRFLVERRFQGKATS